MLLCSACGLLDMLLHTCSLRQTHVLVKQRMQEVQLMQKCLIFSLTKKDGDHNLFSISRCLFESQQRHPFTGNLNSETPGDSTDTFLHWGDVLGMSDMCALVFADCSLL